MSFTEMFLFLTGLGSMIKFSFGGELFIPDLFLALAMPFFFQRFA